MCKRTNKTDSKIKKDKRVQRVTVVTNQSFAFLYWSQIFFWTRYTDLWRRPELHLSLLRRAFISHKRSGSLFLSLRRQKHRQTGKESMRPDWKGRPGGSSSVTGACLTAADLAHLLGLIRAIFTHADTVTTESGWAQECASPLCLGNEGLTLCVSPVETAVEACAAVIRFMALCPHIFFHTHRHKLSHEDTMCYSVLLKPPAWVTNQLVSLTLLI